MNIATNAMEKMTEMVRAVDRKYKEMATEPYGTRKATAREQRQMIASMTPEKLMSLINQYGVKSVNEWLSTYWKEE